MRPVWYEIDDEPMENLVPIIKKKMLTGPAAADYIDNIGVGKRLLQSALEGMIDCKHDYGPGLYHFWNNPACTPPCQLARVDGQWYRRKSCAEVPPLDEWGEPE